MSAETTGQIRLRKATLYRDIEIAARGVRDEREGDTSVPATSSVFHFLSRARVAASAARRCRAPNRRDSSSAAASTRTDTSPVLLRAFAFPLPSPDLPSVAQITWRSRIADPLLGSAARLLGTVVPVFVRLMIDHRDSDWEDPSLYPDVYRQDRNGPKPDSCEAPDHSIVPVDQSTETR